MKGLKRATSILWLPLLTLCGCTAIGKRVSQISGTTSEQPNYVFYPGYRVQIAGNSAMIQGFDECPEQPLAGTLLFGQDTKEDRFECILITPTTKTTRVLVASTGGTVQEEWSIDRGVAGPGSFSFRRPDGT
ncbi:hypothetical protein [Granulicella sp. L46]|uniref:hypothetical protein n=1 Tax=Granulicella sp. L46 TaxID=1641865 RepID=UPI00131D2782|nr:hypothetical protein [Granulicella sp. L46]